MKIIDISWPVTVDMTAYKNRKSVEIKQTRTMINDEVMESHICMNVHTGTHVDAPAHLLPTGKGVDEIPLDSLCGLAKVFNLTNRVGTVLAEHIADLPIHNNDIVLFKTKNSFLSSTASFNEEFVYLSLDAVIYLFDRGVKAVGVDYLSIERNQPDHGSHKYLMHNGIPIVEGLRLADVAPGNYFFIAFPLKLVGLDGAPTRAVLIEGLTE